MTRTASFSSSATDGNGAVLGHDAPHRALSKPRGIRTRLGAAAIALVFLSFSGCTWCVDQCIGPAARPVRPPPSRPPVPDPCDLVPGSLYRSSNGSSLFFDVDYVEWRHDGQSEIFDWRCRDGWIQFREGHMASDANLRGERELQWLGTLYVLEHRR